MYEMFGVIGCASLSEAILRKVEVSKPLNDMKELFTAGNIDDPIPLNSLESW